MKRLSELETGEREPASACLIAEPEAEAVNDPGPASGHRNPNPNPTILCTEPNA
jgi:hypothetical protein